ncbi:unnamed protein product [Rotaria sp. Silwood1]|nr:unnamed protein product [Rotaria sp. Silwood1]CAF3663305.1 unnamed protein product [Rotaria sp. Silwood1]CAF3682697.1 unnamed protein product [Rotaria sp. Silwood1]
MFKEKYLRRLKITTSKYVSLMKLQNDPRVPSQSDNSIYDLYTIPKDADDDSDVFNYTTSNDIISTLINGDHEIIRTLDLLIHITKVKVIENTMKRDARLPKLFYLAVGFKSEKLVGRCQIAYRFNKKWKISRSTMN